MDGKAAFRKADAADLPLAREILGAIRGSVGTGVAPDGRTVRCIPFRDYMSLCLYHPEYGYYRTGRIRTGREGDFYTSAYVGDAMGELLAERLAALAEERFPGAERVEVVDYGGGAGRLSGQMLERWKAMGAAGERFALTLVDGHPSHLEQAGARLKESMQEGRARILTADAAETEIGGNRPVMVVANELLDAFPVNRVTRKDGRLWEQGVCEDETGRGFSFCLMEPADPALAGWLERQRVRLKEGQTADIGLEAAKWTAGLYGRFGSAILILIDYGDTTRELAAEYRMDGTLLCYAGHRASANPFLHPGGQDMTAHVDFELVRYYASEAGWEELWYGTQKRFLVESGILGKLSGHTLSDPFHPLVRRNRTIRQLLLSDSMSELFKVQIWAKS